MNKKWQISDNNKITILEFINKLTESKIEIIF